MGQPVLPARREGLEPAWNQWGRGRLLCHVSRTGAREVGISPFPACQAAKNWIPMGGLGWDIMLLTEASRQPICCHCHAAAVTQQSCQGGHLYGGSLWSPWESKVWPIPRTVGMGNLMDLGAGRMWSCLDFLGKCAWNQWAVVDGVGGMEEEFVIRVFVLWYRNIILEDLLWRGEKNTIWEEGYLPDQKNDWGNPILKELDA